MGYGLILNLRINDAYYYAETWPEMSELIDMVIREQRFSIPGVGAGDPVSFCFADRRHTADTRSWWPDNYLRVGVNVSTGYGGSFGCKSKACAVVRR